MTTLPTLRNGDTGEGVRFLEQLLSSIYWFSILKPNSPNLININVIFDAVYDDQCEQIVRQFQQNYNTMFPFPAENITVDGVVGPQTWKALGDAVFRYTYSFL